MTNQVVPARSPLLLIHPIGVGLSARFWDRFISQWNEAGDRRELIAPNLLGCGSAPSPRQPLTPDDWATALIEALQRRNSAPVILVSQGASLPIALAVMTKAPHMVSGLVAISPPGWRVLKDSFPVERSQQLWKWLFSGVIGNLFYRYARRRSFLKSFSENNLFARHQDVDEEWLETLHQGSKEMDSRWAVFSFLAGFWRCGWEPALTAVSVPFLVVFGRSATGIGRSSSWDDLQERLKTYSSKLNNAEIHTIEGRNVLPYESTKPCVNCVQSWLQEISS